MDTPTPLPADQSPYPRLASAPPASSSPPPAPPSGLVKRPDPPGGRAESLVESFRTLAGKSGYCTPARAAQLDDVDARREAHARAQRAELARKNCGLFPKYATASLREDGYVRERLGEEDFARYAAARDELASLLVWPGTLILRGGNGPGKTYLAAALVNAFCDAGKPARYTTAADFFLALKSTFGAEGKTQEDLVKRFRAYALLVLDEIEVRSDSAWENNVLRGLVDARYAGGVSTVIVTNKTADEIETYFSPAIRDRIREGGAVVNCDWPSLRGSARYAKETP